MNQEEARQIAQEIMDNFDENQDNKISLDEYSDKYIEILKKLRHRQVAMEDKMLESYEQYKHVWNLLKNVRYEQEIQFKKQCLLNVIEVRNLPKKMSKPFIKIQVERMVQGQVQIVDLGETQAQTYENTVYNRRFQFDVYDDNDKIVIQVIDSKMLSQPIQTYILLRELRTYMDDVSIEVKELWFNFD